MQIFTTVQHLKKNSEHRKWLERLKSILKNWFTFFHLLSHIFLWPFIFKIRSLRTFSRNCVAQYYSLLELYQHHNILISSWDSLCKNLFSSVQLNNSSQLFKSVMYKLLKISIRQWVNRFKISWLYQLSLDDHSNNTTLVLVYGFWFHSISFCLIAMQRHFYLCKSKPLLHICYFSNITMPRWRLAGWRNST